MRIYAVIAALIVSFLLLPAVSSVVVGDAYASTKTSKKTKVVSQKSSVSKQASKNKSFKKVSSKTKQRLKNRYATKPSAPEKDKYAAVVVDATTGRVLYQKNAGELRYPASLTKMMTLYLTFDALKKGKLSLGSEMPISAKAARMPETNINLVAGDTLMVEDAIKSLVIRSANDASVVVAEKLGGTTWNFAQMMNKKARELGMKDTVFRNPNGLPDDGQYTSAFDMARLGIALRRDFPEYYKYFSNERFDFGGVTYTTHNRVLQRYEGADGIKTGYIRASGFNVVTSVKKNGYSLVAVVMGGSSGTARDDMMINMLDRTFASLPSKRNNVASSAQRSSTQTAQVTAN